MRGFSLRPVVFFALLLSCLSGVASEMSESDREIRERQLSRDKAILEEKRMGLPQRSIEILEAYCAASQNRLDGDDYACALDLLKTYELCVEEERKYEAHGHSEFGALWEQFGADYGILPSGAALICLQSDSISPDRKLQLMARISCVAPWDGRAHDYFREFLERWWPYPGIIRFCERKEAAGYGYFRFMRVKMLIHYQCELIEAAAMRRYKGVYDEETIHTCHYEPGLVEHKEFKLAIHEAMTDPDRSAFRLKQYAELFATWAYYVVQKKEEILEYLAFARKIALEHVEEEKKQGDKDDSRRSDWDWALRRIDELIAEVVSAEDAPNFSYNLRSDPSPAIQAKIDSGEWSVPGVDVLDAVPGDCPDTTSEQADGE